jgi:hypothetical protein
MASFEIILSSLADNKYQIELYRVDGSPNHILNLQNLFFVTSCNPSVEEAVREVLRFLSNY